MTRQKEELLTDSASRLIIYQAGLHREKKIDEMAELTGLKTYRVRRRSRELEKHGFITVDKGLSLKMLDRNVEALQRFKDNLSKFADRRSDTISHMIEEASQQVEEKIKELENMKKETESVTAQKKYEARIQLLEEALQEKDYSSPEECLHRFSELERVRKRFCSAEEIHGCNIVRKSRTLRGLDEIFSNEFRST